MSLSSSPFIIVLMSSGGNFYVSVGIDINCVIIDNSRSCFPLPLLQKREREAIVDF